MNTLTALMIIDVQLGMFDERFPVYQGGQLLNTLNTLISQARASGTPIIYIQHNGGDENDPIHPASPGWVIHPAIQPAPGDLVIHKQHPDSFQDTPLQSELESRGIKNLIVGGIQTEFCVDTTCRRAYSLGYNVTLVQNGHTTWDTKQLTAAQIIAHHNENLGGWFVKLKNADEIQFDPSQA
jgi:nicotinamidase-related amidase